VSSHFNGHCSEPTGYCFITTLETDRSFQKVRLVSDQLCVS